MGNHRKESEKSYQGKHRAGAPGSTAQMRKEAERVAAELARIDAQTKRDADKKS